MKRRNEYAKTTTPDINRYKREANHNQKEANNAEHICDTQECESRDAKAWA